MSDGYDFSIDYSFSGRSLRGIYRLRDTLASCEYRETTIQYFSRGLETAARSEKTDTRIRKMEKYIAAR